MSTPREEAEKYKDSSIDQLRKVLKDYKSLSRSNSDISNFLWTFGFTILGSVLFLKITLGNFLLVTLFHYLFFWEYLHKYKGFKLVSDKDREEIDEIIEILEGYIKERETKNPS